MKQWCVYILQCNDKYSSFYVGMTNDLAQRLIAHQQGKASKFTRSRLPITLVKTISCQNKSEALKLERQLKKLNRTQKLVLVRS